jgi:GTP cyclohydrolase I
VAWRRHPVTVRDNCEEDPVQTAHPETGNGHHRRSPVATFAARRPPCDLAAAERAVADLLAALGASLNCEAAQNTPARVAAGLAELLTPADFTLTTFPNTKEQHELVIARDVPFRSLCAHHLLPFTGTAQVGYLPGERIAGISKLARVVGVFAARLQVQEEMGQQIVGWLDEHLKARGVAVLIAAEHCCMTLRGVRAVGAGMVTLAVRGALRDDAAVRAEFLQLAAVPRRCAS